MCAICEREPATVKLAHMTVCPACKVLVQAEADRRLALVVDALVIASREEVVPA